MRTVEEIIKEIADFKMKMEMSGISTDNIAYLLSYEDYKTLKEYMYHCGTGAISEDSSRQQFGNIYGMKIMVKHKY